MNIFQRFEMNLEYNCCLKYCLNIRALFSVQFIAKVFETLELSHILWSCSIDVLNSGFT